MTQQKLQQPIVMCGLGRLYSKQNVIERLLDQNGMPESCSHIKSLKDIRDLKLAANPAYSTEDDKNAPFICALIGLEMSGQFRFVALWTCGCVFSERASKQLKSSVCSICQTPYSEQDVVILNGNDADVDIMRTKMEARIARLKAERKSKKSKAAQIEATATLSAGKTSETESPLPATVKLEPGCSKSISQSSLLKKIETAHKRAIITDLIDPNSKKSKKDYSVACDSNGKFIKQICLLKDIQEIDK